MRPPKSSATIRITTDLGPASNFANSSTVIELKGRTNHEKGELYLKLSLTGLRELDNLLRNEQLSASDKAIYDRAYVAGMKRYDEVKKIRDQLFSQKKSFRRFLVNLFVYNSDARTFHEISYSNYVFIRSTSDEISRLLLPDRNTILGSLGESSHPHVSACEESPRDVVEVKDLPPDETLRGISMDIDTEEEVNEVLTTLNRIATSGGEEEEGGGDDDDDDDDGSRTARPSISQISLRPPSPTGSLTVIYNYNNSYLSNSVVSIDSEVSGTTINSGVNRGSPDSERYQSVYVSHRLGGIFPQELRCLLRLVTLVY
ncbi:hypothetical protein K503DRAFT_867276 [Rhizopogon vinicolor AM-OR11-026]|uniref:Uncharacterized protein n=1 Tax=Rhizopogon vinicolor AM-OR11-026 TaxID=1314800 RepID=A0A1B7MW64_9AGAM|nr:hypothetical protein K503DRAFT_867276 [Rhizopogon vinicolor AM-OR11-026]